MQTESLEPKITNVDDALKSRRFSIRTIKFFSWATYLYIYFFGVVTLLAMTTWYHFYFSHLKYFL